MNSLYLMKCISRVIPLVIFTVFIGCSNPKPFQKPAFESANTPVTTESAVVTTGVEEEAEAEAVEAEAEKSAVVPSPTAPEVVEKAPEPAAPPVEVKSAIVEPPPVPVRVPAPVPEPSQKPIAVPALPIAEDTETTVVKPEPERTSVGPAVTLQGIPKEKQTSSLIIFNPTGITVIASEEKEKKISSSLNPEDPKSVLYLDTKGNLAGTGDPKKSGSPSASYRLGGDWHPAALASNLLPKDKYGLVDWAKAAKENLLTPRHSIDPDAEDIPSFDFNILIEAKSNFVKDVVFPHYIHTWWLKCEICHPKIFIPVRGANNMTMVGMIVDNKFCGRCHGKIAFPFTDCNRCHTSPKKPQTVSK